jgi:magnesium transporter
MQAQEVKSTETIAGCTPRAVAFDFAAKREAELQFEQLEVAFARGQFVWIDVAFSDVADARELLNAFGVLGVETIEDALTRTPATQLARYEEYVHFVVSAAAVVNDRLAFERIDCAIGERYMITSHRDGIVFVDGMRRNYQEDFARFAITPSFLVYELWDTLIEGYLQVQRDLAKQVAALTARLMDRSEGESLFTSVAKLGAELLEFRKMVLLARAVLNDLATRHSLYVSETTQGQLLNLIGSLEHVLQELLVDRDVLSESLALHRSLMSHRNNRVIKQLTAANLVFLPLTFLCGVYGMNSRHLPELEWQYSYAIFWVIAVCFAVFVGWLTRRLRWW